MWGTHNALVSLGPAIYLEVIAPDPEASVPERGVHFGMERRGESALATWALRCDSLEEAAARAHAAGVDLGPVESGGRVRGDGTALSWRLTDPYAPRLGGAVPFLIAWGDAPHPAGAAPRAGELVGLRAVHPEPARVLAAFGALGVEMDVGAGPQFRLIAKIRTADGLRELG